MGSATAEIIWRYCLSGNIYEVQNETLKVIKNSLEWGFFSTYRCGVMTDEADDTASVWIPLCSAKTFCSYKISFHYKLQRLFLRDEYVWLLILKNMFMKMRR